MVLYKYAGASGLKILDALRLKVTPPNELNDPFELTPRSQDWMTRQYLLDKAKHDPEHFRPAYDEWREQEHRSESFSVFLRALHLMSRKTYSHFLHLYRAAIVEADLRAVHEASEHMVVLCLSAVNNSIPMWSHYANHHKGITIGLDANDRCLRFGSPLCRVKYRKNRVSLNRPATSTPQARLKKVIEMILTKSPDWEYEQEYRFSYAKSRTLRQTTDDGHTIHLIPVWPSAIKEVIFGCSASQQYEDKVRRMLDLNRFAHVRILRARRHPKHFRLDIVPA
ncbi:MAG: DUF2971 domain-containing protein [Verrucomicrobiota bacterium]